MQPDILIVDDDPGAVRLLGKLVCDLGTTRFASSGTDALRLASTQAPDLVLLDAEMEGMSGFDVCVALKADPALADVPVIFVTSHRDESFEVRGFEAGASDFIIKPVNATLVAARVRAQLRFKRMSDELKLQALLDPLTALGNRRRFERALDSEWLRARRGGTPLSLLLVDVDHFKAYNDRYGHPAGDACLRLIAGALRAACLRPADLAARCGGEEFALLLPETDAAGAQRVAERVLEGVAALGLPHEASATAPIVTVSLGVASYAERLRIVEGEGPARGQPVGPQDLVAVADAALYDAKGRGRARVAIRALDSSQGADNCQVALGAAP